MQEASARGVGKRRSVPAAVVLGLCAFGIGPGGLVVGWSLTPNPAADQVAPVLRDLRAEGAVRVCEAGDAGRGPDNFTAWQTGFYRVPARTATPAALRRLYGQHGHDLLRVSGDGTADPSGIALSTTRGDSADRSLSVVISRGPVTLQCTVDGEYGRAYTPPAGERLLVVSSDAPPW